MRLPAPDHPCAGNELYGIWSAALAAGAEYNGATYATSFIEMRAELRRRMPQRWIALGLVLAVNPHAGDGIANWDHDIFRSTAPHLADFVIVHAYFTKGARSPWHRP